MRAQVVNELDNTVTGFTYDRGTGKLSRTLSPEGPVRPAVSTLPVGWATGAASFSLPPPGLLPRGIRDPGSLSGV